MKKIIVLLGICLSLLANDIIVFENEYKVLELDKKVKKIIVGNKDIMNISLLNESNSQNTLLKLFGKKSGNTSILVVYRDKSIESFHIYVNQNLGYIQKMINTIEPKLVLSKVGDGSTVISGTFEDPHQKKRILDLLKNGGIDTATLMDLTETKKVNKMIRTKLYLVEVNNNKAKEKGGVTGLEFFSEYTDLALNAGSVRGATFSGFLLDHTREFTEKTGNSLVGTLRFLEDKGIAKILDDTVLITTEDNNASFHVGGEVYIPIGLTENPGGLPTIILKEKEYGLRLTLKTKFMEKNDFMHMDIQIKDSEFDSNHGHDIQLGENTFVPSFISKHINTDIVARSKQVIALGGRLHTEKVKYEEKVPFLGDIPIIGALFRSETTSKKENDILFFLVPEIVDANKDVNDTTFYRTFKEENLKFHENILDMNSSKEKAIAQENKIIADTNTTVEDAQIEQEMQEPIIEIQLEDDNSPATVAVSAQIIIEESNEENSSVSNKEEISWPKEIASIDEAKYEVSVGKLFLRDKPMDGKRVMVWSEGHSFTISAQEEHGGIVWLKVKEDCIDECTPINKELWISQKYTSLL